MKNPLGERRIVVNKNRVIVGVLLLIAALVTAIYLLPSYIESRQAKYTILVVKKDISPGFIFSDDDIVISKTTDRSLADTAFSDPANIVGKTATRYLFAGRYIFSEDVAESYTEPTIYNTLPEGYLLMSISIPSPAASVAGQIQTDDIIRLYSLDENGIAYTPSELEYVKVLAVYDNSGSELLNHTASSNENGPEASDNSLSNRTAVTLSSGASSNIPSTDNGHECPSVIALLVTQKQALKLVELEKSGGHYMSLVSRGNKALESTYLEWQYDILDNLSKGMNG